MKTDALLRVAAAAARFYGHMSGLIDRTYAMPKVIEVRVAAERAMPK
jgi:hypothetical protein